MFFRYSSFFLFLSLSVPLLCTGFDLAQLNHRAQEILGYDPHITALHEDTSQEIMITCHGYGGNRTIGHVVATYLPFPILTFDFQDHDLDEHTDVQLSTFGTVDECTPILYLLKACVDRGISTIHLYGFSAGGGALINALAILNNPGSRETLSSLGISEQVRAAILEALSQGIIILDAPLKSVGELLSIRPEDPTLTVLAQRYATNNLEPLETVKNLKYLSLTIYLYFERPDEVLSNRDDELYYQRLKQANKPGKTILIVDQDGGHSGPHKKLWHAIRASYVKKRSTNGV
jgi:hypothetical protein